MGKKEQRDFPAIKKRLLNRREEIRNHLDRLTGGDAEAGEKPVGDLVDDAVMDAEQDSSYTIAQQEARELRLIDEALDKIEEGTYGICEECGEQIERPRLKALPYAVLCLKCKENEELEQAAEGGGY